MDSAAGVFLCLLFFVTYVGVAASTGGYYYVRYRQKSQKVDPHADPMGEAVVVGIVWPLYWIVVRLFFGCLIVAPARWAAKERPDVKPELKIVIPRGVEINSEEQYHRMRELVEKYETSRKRPINK